MPDSSPPTPRIGFNALLLSPSGDFRAAGIHRYITALLQALDESQGSEITAAVADARARSLVPARMALAVAPPWARKRVGRIAWEQAGLPRVLRRSGAQLLHSAAYAMPAACPVPAVVTVHDLSFFRLPDTFPKRQGMYLRAATRHAARRAAALVAVSDFTRRELIALLGVDPARVHVVHNGLDASFRPLDRAAVEAWRAERDLPKRFVLSVGTLQPRKNLDTLLRAYAAMRADTSGAETPALVVAGGAGWGDTDIAARAEAMGIGDAVHVTGFVPDEDMPRLYNAAEVLAFPSLYEGFGLPALEAMACGTPVVASDVSSLPEVVGDAGVLVPAEDVRAWSAALGALLGDAPRREGLRAAGLAQAARFSWTRAARETEAVWQAVLAAEACKGTAVAALNGVTCRLRTLPETIDTSADSNTTMPDVTAHREPVSAGSPRQSRRGGTGSQRGAAGRGNRRDARAERSQDERRDGGA